MNVLFGSLIAGVGIIGISADMHVYVEKDHPKITLFSFLKKPSVIDKKEDVENFLIDYERSIKVSTRFTKAQGFISAICIMTGFMLMSKKPIRLNPIKN